MRPSSMHAGEADVKLYDELDLKIFVLVVWYKRFLSVACPTGTQQVLFLLQIVCDIFWLSRDDSLLYLRVTVSDPSWCLLLCFCLCHFLIIAYIYLFVKAMSCTVYFSPFVLVMILNAIV